MTRHRKRLILLTWLADFAIFGCAASAVAIALGLPNSVPGAGTLVLIASLFVLEVLLSRLFFGSSAGQLIEQLPSAKFMTLLLLMSFVSLSFIAVVRHPLAIPGSPRALTRALPQETQLTSRSRFVVIPFYYALGAWPWIVDGEQGIYSLPYEKGVPERFLPRIIARWPEHRIQFTWEGPTTPKNPIPLEQIERCMNGFRISCLKTRDELLSPSLKKISNSRLGGKIAWKTGWFSIGDSARGIYLTGQGSEMGRSRYILITDRGTQQTLTAEYPTEFMGLAHEILEQTLASLQFSTTLSDPKSWINQQLAASKVSPEMDLGKLSEIQTLLLSKLSVDPKTYDTYYHLMGVTLLLARKARSEKLGLPGLQALAESCFLYAKDVSPDERRNAELQNMLLDVRKLSRE